MVWEESYVLMIERKNNLFWGTQRHYDYYCYYCYYYWGRNTTITTLISGRGNYLGHIVCAFYSSIIISFCLLLNSFTRHLLHSLTTIVLPFICYGSLRKLCYSWATTMVVSLHQPLYWQIWQSNSTCRVVVLTQNSQKGFHVEQPHPLSHNN